jgi:hypothetical protein
MPKVVIYTDFDGTLTNRDGRKTINSDFYQSLLQDRGMRLKPDEEVQSLFEEKFGEYSPEVYTKLDSDMLLSLESIAFLKELLQIDEVAINIVTKNCKDYVVALLTYHGFPEENIDKINILDSGKKAKDVKANAKDLTKALKSSEELRNTRIFAYLFDDTKSDLEEMSSSSCLDREYFKVKTFSTTPGKFKWAEYLNTIKTQLSSISESKSRPLGINQELFPNEVGKDNPDSCNKSPDVGEASSNLVKKETKLDL